jgi:serine/threonine protein kinase
MKHCPSCQSAFPTSYTHCPRDGSALADSTEWSEGTVVRGKYQIIAKIGQGGMAAVYKALHMRFNEPRAIKVINPELASDASFVRRFEQEAIITRKLQHPNAVRVDDIDEAEDGRPFIVMEYVEGRNLKEVIEQEAPMPVARVCSIVTQAAAALDAAHHLGLVHRDIKPANIALVGSADSREPASDRVKVLDFGIAKLKEADLEESNARHETLTGTGTVIGTPAYMSPEQAKGLRGDQLDGRSDIYSLGVVAYQMLTGDLPLKADSTLELLMAHISTTPKPIQEARPDLKIPDAVAAVVMRCLEKNRESRPASGQALIEEIELAADRGPELPGPSSATKPELPVPPSPVMMKEKEAVAAPPTAKTPAVPRVQPSKARHSRWLLVAAVLLGAAVGGVLYQRWRKHPVEPEVQRVAPPKVENKPPAGLAGTPDSANGLRRESPQNSIAVDKAVAEGNRDIAEGQYDTALNRFLTVIAVDPQNSAARAGLLRAQQARKFEFPDFHDPLSEAQVIQLLERGAAPDRIAEAADEQGIDFDLTPQTVTEITWASGGNATDATKGLFSKLREINVEYSQRMKPPGSPAQPGNSVPPAGPTAGPALAAPTSQVALLEIHTNPAAVVGVYVDDQQRGFTAADGRLQISGLSPGQHRLRLEVQNFVPHEDTVDLVAGLNTKWATLVRSSPGTSPGTATASDPVAGEAFDVLHHHGGTLGFNRNSATGTLRVSKEGLQFNEYGDRADPTHDFKVSCAEVTEAKTIWLSTGPGWFRISFRLDNYDLMAGSDWRKGVRSKGKSAEIVAAIHTACGQR